MKEFIAKYQKAIVGTGAVSVLLICFLQQKELARLRKVETAIEIVSPESGDPIKVSVEQLKEMVGKYKAQADSLHDENFPCQIELGRYQVAYQILLERNPKAAKQYGDIISEETE